MRLEFEQRVESLPLVEAWNGEHVADPAEIEGLLKKGIAAARVGDRELARRFLSEVADVDGRSIDALMWLASISEYPEELLAYLDRVLDIEPENEGAANWHAATRRLLAKTFVQRGLESRDQGDNAAARRCFDQALVCDYDCTPAWLGKASVAEDDVARLPLLERVLVIDPENDEARRALDEIKACN